MNRQGALLVVATGLIACCAEDARAAHFEARASILDGGAPVADDFKMGSSPVFASVLNGGTDVFGTSKRFVVDAGGGGGEFNYLAGSANYTETFTQSATIGTVSVLAAYALEGPYATADLSIDNFRGELDSDQAVVNHEVKSGTLSAEFTGDLTFGFELRIATFANATTSDPQRAKGHVSITSVTVNGTAIFPGELPGDYDGDGFVDSDDYFRWRDHFGLNGATFEMGDGDADADVDGNDFLTWQQNLGASADASLSAVPEPYGIAAGAIGLATLIGAARRRRTA